MVLVGSLPRAISKIRKIRVKINTAYRRSTRCLAISNDLSSYVTIQVVARQWTARCSRACDSAVGEHLIYNRKPANSRFSEKNKNRKNPLRLMQNGSNEPLILWLAENPPSKLGNFQPVTASPYRVLHQAQGDKQKKTCYCDNYGMFRRKNG